MGIQSRLSGQSRPLAGAALALLLAAAGPAAAQDLKIGVASEPSAIDPHFHNLGPNNQIANYVYEALILQDGDLKPIPGLADTWKLIDDTTWEFHIRKGATFSDGAPVGPEDVQASFERIPTVPRSPANFAGYTKGKTIEKVDDLTFRIKTAAPYPLMLTDLASVAIIPRSAVNASTEDFNARKIPGAGAYKFAEYVQGDRLVLERNEKYWGKAPEWQRVLMRPIKSDPTRVAALLSGDVDVIEQAPTADLAKLRTNPAVTLYEDVSTRLIMLRLEFETDNATFVSAKDGSPIKNPFKDLRVRQALSKAMNRTAIMERVMEGASVPASQFLPDGLFGTSRALKAEPFDLAGAKKLLADAGYPDGFKMRIFGPNGRYVNDARVLEAIAQMFTRAGIETSVETFPPAVFFSRAARGPGGVAPELSLVLTGWAPASGETSDSVKNLVGSYDTAQGRGMANPGGFSSAKVDDLLAKALVTVDDEKRATYLAQASDAAMAELGVIPIHYQKNVWAMRKGLRMLPTKNERTYAWFITKA